jgi:hypothetical protein
MLETLPGALEGSINILLPTVVVHRQPDPGVDNFLVPGQ